MLEENKERLSKTEYERGIPEVRMNENELYKRISELLTGQDYTICTPIVIHNGTILSKDVI